MYSFEDECKSVNSEDLCLNFRKATRAVTKYYDHYLAPIGLRSTQFSLLLEIGSEPGGQNLSDIARQLVMDRTTITRNIKPLQKKGLVKPVNCTDGRMRKYILTKDGLATVYAGLNLWRDTHHAVVEWFSEEFGSSGYEDLMVSLKSMLPFRKIEKEDDL